MSFVFIPALSDRKKYIPTIENDARPKVHTALCVVLRIRFEDRFLIDPLVVCDPPARDFCHRGIGGARRRRGIREVNPTALFEIRRGCDIQQPSLTRNHHRRRVGNGLGLEFPVLIENPEMPVFFGHQLPAIRQKRQRPWRLQPRGHDRLDDVAGVLGSHGFTG